MPDLLPDHVPPEDITLKHLTRWNHIAHRELFERNTNTMQHIPRAALSRYQEAKAVALEHLAQTCHANPTTAHTDAAWKLVIRMDHLILHNDTTKTRANEATQTEVINQRLTWFWAGAWDHLLGDPRPANTSHNDEGNTYTRLARRIKHLIQIGEVGRATTLTTTRPQFTNDPNDKARIQSKMPQAHTPPQPEPPTIHSPVVHNLSTNKARSEHMARLLRHLPRNKSPGPEGSRNEHWTPMRDHEPSLAHLHTIIDRIVRGQLPPDALDAILTNSMAAKKKATTTSAP